MSLSSEGQIVQCCGSISTGQMQQAAATDSRYFHDEAASVLFTDPPYYDAIPYADLADFFSRLAQSVRYQTITRY